MRLALFIISLLLLLPGICGGVYFVLIIPFTIDVILAKTHPEVGALVFFGIVYSIIIGCLGILAVANLTEAKPDNSRRWVLTAFILSSAITVILLAYLFGLGIYQYNKGSAIGYMYLFFHSLILSPPIIASLFLGKHWKKIR